MADPTGSYGKFYDALYDEVKGSAALTAKYTGSGSASGQVKQGWHLWTDASTHESLIADGPVIYVEPGSLNGSPDSPDSASLECEARVIICEYFDQSSANDLITSINFVDALRQEIMSEADGTGGTSSWLPKGGNVRVTMDPPEKVDDKINEVRTVLTVRAYVPESV